jgi:hypothetical protein
LVAAGDAGGQMIVWDSGEGELEFFDAAGRFVQKHFDDLTDDSIPCALDELDALLRELAG